MFKMESLGGNVMITIFPNSLRQLLIVRLCGYSHSYTDLICYLTMMNSIIPSFA